MLETPQSRYDRRSGKLANQRSRERRKRKISEMRGGDRAVGGRVSLRPQLDVWELGAVQGMKIACLDVGRRKIGG